MTKITCISENCPWRYQVPSSNHQQPSTAKRYRRRAMNATISDEALVPPPSRLCVPRTEVVVLCQSSYPRLKDSPSSTIYSNTRGLVLWILVLGYCVVLPSNALVCPDVLDR
jgi:hypothetical protein